MKILPAQTGEAAVLPSSGYAFLAQSRDVQRQCALFYQATGLSVMLVSADGPDHFCLLAGPRHSLCQLITQTGHRLATCERFAQPLPTVPFPRTHPACPAGLTEWTVPILVHQQPVARLLCGQVFCKPPTAQDFDRVWNRFRRWGLPLERQCTKRAFFQTRVLPKQQGQAAAELLGQMAHRFATALQQWLAQPHAREPRCVQQAKDLVETRLTEKFTTHLAALATHVSEQYFCLAFKRAMGMTFTAYVARRRIDRAEQLLADPSTQIVDVAHAVGFGSLSQFDRAFKRYSGVTAMAYRRAILPGENPSKDL